MHLAGAFNRDHAIDGRDLLFWQHELGSTPTYLLLGAPRDPGFECVMPST